jgi:tetratricopeptide (TPR) repeat protein
MSFWSKARDIFKRLAGAASGDAGPHVCDHRDSRLEAGTPEFELAIAEAELKSGNLVHGAHHLAHLISFDPARREWIELLEEYLRRVNRDDAKLYPHTEERYFAQEAVRAYAWARKGKWEEAISLLAQVVQAKPDSAYFETWGSDWLGQPQALASMSQTTIEYAFAFALNRFPETRWLSRKQRLHLERFAHLAAKVPRSKQNTAVMQMTRAGLLRKLGRFDEALALARSAIRELPNWHTYVAEGLILRESGDCEAAAASFHHALVFDQEDLAARLEAGDGYLTNRSWNKARAWYGEVLERKPTHPWALPSQLFCEWKACGDAQKHARLVELARANPPNDRAVQLLRWREPYVGFLPGPADATANVLRQLTPGFRKERPKPGGSLTLGVSHLESPSAALAIEEQLKAFDCPMPVVVTVQAIQSPDPRVPCRPVQHTLWRYNGTTATPALPRPPTPIVKTVAELALTEYDYDKNWEDAKRVALDLRDGNVPQLLAVMVHPPRVPAGKEAIDWLPRVQLATAQIIANIGIGWVGSARRDGLYSALFGPRDWITNAAIIALARLGADNEEIAFDVHDAFRTLESVITDSGYCCFAHALFTNWQLLAGLPDEESQRVQARLLELE